MQPGAALELKDLVVGRGSTPVAGPLSFSLAPGESLVITGPNGCGKTTLARCLAGVAAPLAGALQRPVNGVSFIPQSGDTDALVPLSVDEVLRFAALSSAANTAQSAMAAHAERAAVLDAVGLPGAQHRRFAQLSGGERQRVQIARVLLSECPLMILDEATSAVDAASEHMLAAAIAAHARQRGRMALVVAHHPAAWVAAGARLLTLNARGTP